MTVYMDCNATTPLEPKVSELMLHYAVKEYGNAGSRTHEFGAYANKAVQKARQQIANVVDAGMDEVFFTSGATESNNIALLGLAEYGASVGHKHIISSSIEHKAVLEPLEYLEKQGFDISLLAPDSKGVVSVESLQQVLREDTLLVSLMHVNNETGVIQPCLEYADALREHSAFFHVDAAQGFGKEFGDLEDERIDLLSISGHKIYGPKGIGALIARKRGFARPPLQPLMYGGGQERGIRPGTLPVPLIAGLGLAAELCDKQHEVRKQRCLSIRQQAMEAFRCLEPRLNGDLDKTVPHVLSLSFPGLDSEAVMIVLKGSIAISNGSACTSSNYTSSHVLEAMQLPEEVIRSTIRISWSHLTEDVDWEDVVERIQSLY